MSGSGTQVLSLDYPPTLPYSVNGTVLDSQPTTMTAPVATAGTIAAGATFTLLFSNPSSATQAALANGSTVTLRFGLVDGSSVSGQVTLASTLVGTTFSVSVTLTQTITINRWVVVTQIL